MSLKTFIADSASGIKAGVVERFNTNTLAVATTPLTSYGMKVLPFLNETYGADLNKNVTLGGTPATIHNGIDVVLWTASAISGTWTFDSTTVAHAGSKSISGIATGKNSTAQLAKGSTQALTGYVAISGWIYLTAWGAGTQHLQFFGWNVSTGVMVGNSVNLDAYIDTSTLGSWQKFVIPLSAMGLVGETVSAFRVVVTATTTAPDFYLDDLVIEETGSPIVYTVKPEQGESLLIEKVIVFMADALASTLADAALPNLAYNKLLGVTALTTGLTLQITRKQQVTGIVFKQLSDILLFPITKIVGSGSDGTNTWIQLERTFAEPIVLEAIEEDQISITVNDDLSGLLLFKVTASGKVEA